MYRAPQELRGAVMQMPFPISSERLKKTKKKEHHAKMK